MTNDIPYTFRQQTDFLQLTGCQEPGAVFVIIKDKHGNTTERLYVEENDDEHERWWGPRTGVEKSEELFEIPCQPIKNLPRLLEEVKNKDISHIYKHNPNNHELDDTFFNPLVLQSNIPVYDPNEYMQANRYKKTPEEITMLKKSAHISAHALKQTMKNTKPGMTEAHLDAILEFEVRTMGAQRLAYPPIVASGTNGTTVIYVANNQVIKEGDMILCDVGAEYHAWPTDVCRTWPVSGKYTDEQRALYDVVLSTNKECIELCADKSHYPGSLYDHSMTLLARGLLRNNIVSGISEFRLKKLVPNLFMEHGLSHSLGSDIHEDILVNGLLPDTMITIEPGIIIKDKRNTPSDWEALYEQCQIPDAFRGMAVRIEDEVLITEDGYEHLTFESPKEMDDIEEIMTQSPSSYANRMYQSPPAF